MRLAVAGLPRRQRTALVLRYYCDYTVAQSAELMRCREQTVKKLTARALTQLRSRLGEDLEDGDSS